MVTIYYEILKVSEEFLGPAAKRFLDRQISFHLKKNPEELSKNDLVELAEWISSSALLLIDDKKVVDDFNNKILLVAGKK